MYITHLTAISAPRVTHLTALNAPRVAHLAALDTPRVVLLVPEPAGRQEDAEGVGEVVGFLQLGQAQARLCNNNIRELSQSIAPAPTTPTRIHGTLIHRTRIHGTRIHQARINRTRICVTRIHMTRIHGLRIHATRFHGYVPFSSSPILYVPLYLVRF